MATKQGANSENSPDAKAPAGTAAPEPAIPRQTDVTLDVDSNSETAPSRIVQSPTSPAEPVPLPAEQGANPTNSHDAQPPAETAPEPVCVPQTSSLTEIRVDVPDPETDPPQIVNLPTSPPPLTPEQKKQVEDCRRLLRAAFEGDWATASEFLKPGSPSNTAIIMSESRTALHIAAMSAQDQFVENLVKLLSPEELEVADGKNCTAIHYAAMGGRIRMVKELVGKNSKLTKTLDGQGYVPLRRSAEYGALSKEVLWFLAIKTKVDGSRGLFPDAQALDTIFYLFCAGHLDVSLYLLRQYPHLAKERMGSKTKRSLLRALSLRPTYFLSGSKLNLWERLLYKCVPVDLNSIPNEYSRISGTPTTTMAQALQMCIKFCKLEALGAFRKLLWTGATIVAPAAQRIHDAKLRHKAAVKLTKLICAEISYMKTTEILQFFKEDDIINCATSKGIVEVLEVCLRSFPELIWTTSNDKTWLTIAVEHRQVEVCGLFLAANSNNSLSIIPTTPEDAESIVMLKAAAKYSPNFGYLSSVPGAAYQMQRELQWFKAVEGWIHPYYKTVSIPLQERETEEGETEKEETKEGETKEGETQEGETEEFKSPWEIFLDEHEELLKSGEKWMKSASSSFLLISTLVAVALFVTALIAPGGNNNNTRAPILLGKNSFMVFAISDALGLFFSVVAILSFSAILTSSYGPEDFLYSLPKKMIIGLSSLFFSLASILAAFATALTILLNERLKWAWIPVTVLSCLPVALFAMLQLPLLYQMVESTFGPSIFRPRKIWKRSRNWWMRTCHKKIS